ncbi:MAG: FtsX-like permease family protein [Eggerthellaceae bacterium]|nr:FtsX-like permease family protein [Eggerthellaceae bacterium]
MKPTQITELFANIRKTFVSFFSILMFVALGVGVFLGISWAGPALENAADALFDEGRFHDFQIQFPYGLTDGDLEELAQVEGVTRVEAERQSFQTLERGGDNLTVKVQSLGRDVDVPIVVEGELPDAPDEMAFHAESAKKLGVSVGDTVTFAHDGGQSASDLLAQDAVDGAGDEGAAEPEDMKYLAGDTFKVTAIVNSADYAAKASATYGYSSSPSGSVDALAWVPDEAFEPQAFFDGYPVVNVSSESLAGSGTFTDGYKNASSAIEGRISALGDELGSARYDDLHGQAQERIDEAQAKLDDAVAKIDQGEKDIADGEQRLANARVELEQGRAEGEARLAAAYQELQGYEATRAEAAQHLSEARSLLAEAESAIAGKKDTDIVKYKGYSATVAEVKAALPGIRLQLAQLESEFNSKSAELDAGWSQYRAGQAEYEATVARYEQQIADGEAQLADAKATIADAKQQVADQTPKLEEAKQELAAMVKYEWSVLPRAYNSGAVEVTTFSGVTNNLSVSMAALFIIVGLLVSYFAVSRIVHEQVTQIGTKKALGLRRGEITRSFLLYSGIAVLAGAIIGAVVGFLLVEGIIGGVLAGMFAFGSYPAYFGWPLFIGMTALELVLVLGATYLACGRILKRHAVDLLRGEEPPTGKTRFYEKWGIWDRAPLFIQTIVNNCVNDRRRVLSTIVGVAGSTALIVTAITLNNDVLKSYDMHYADVYGFNAIAYVDNGVEGTVDGVESALQDEGATTARVLMKRYLLQQPDGESGSMRVVVPLDEDTFAQVYRVNPLSGAALDLSAAGTWVSQAYAEHMGAKVGDVIVLDGGDGTKHEVPILGINEFWLTYHEMVMGAEYFRQEFGEASPNAVLVQTGGASVDDVAEAVTGIDGFDSIIDDATEQYGNFATFSTVSGAVVAIYLALAALMAVVVLLNLNVMFIDEKKRELIVLMINGYSVKDAKHYISYDSIVLTALGIVVGIILGCVMGSVTVAAIEPSTGSFVKSADVWAIAIGIAGSALLALIMNQIALRRIPRFNLTDINKQ